MRIGCWVTEVFHPKGFSVPTVYRCSRPVELLFVIKPSSYCGSKYFSTSIRRSGEPYINLQLLTGFFAGKKRQYSSTKTPNDIEIAELILVLYIFKIGEFMVKSRK